jgi:hypothetical protein
MLIISLCPAAQADSDKGEVDLQVEILGPPSVITVGTWPVLFRLAVLRGCLEKMGTASPVSVYFEWGTDTDFSYTTEPKPRTRPGRFLTILTGLKPDTTYYFRVVAVGDGISYGSIKSFTTRKPWWWWWW